MLHRKKAKLVKYMLGTLVAGPISFNILAGQGQEVHASIGRAAGAATTVSRVQAQNLRYTLSSREKVIGGFGFAVSVIAGVGTIVGMTLTQLQYNEAEKVNHTILQNTHDAFYNEREKYMKNLFDSWGVPMPDKYKNPISKPESNQEVKPGFSIGG
ncbi:hypothetical protein [Candidatus Arthromitus sp. SFB-rat-Yit]|uniref:hypothetical protein n=1 Tax=Candidatus Arthromitus sp. SFB-rat-Yit TaxID=1041504 RepID=UPI000227A399|nr:hypothetical protein [Candidatus Arthromitus sp. SFB-rat-Yit]BAK81494.1 hypothetical protein RATSFB_0932 [Candidatus Arthromitus sp. SFB-rat-Yit]